MVPSRYTRSTTVARAFYGACLEHDGDLAGDTIQRALEVTFRDLLGMIDPAANGQLAS